MKKNELTEEIPIFDVIIVGGGPAGSTAGKILSENGLKCLLLDHHEFPRNKICGGALSLEIISKYPYIKKFTISSTAHGIIETDKKERIELIKTIDEPTSYFCRRIDFDNNLLNLTKKSNIIVKEKHLVIDVVEEEEYVIVKTKNNGKFKGKFVIGSDGMFSIVRKKAGLQQYFKENEIALIYVNEIKPGRETVKKLFTAENKTYIHFNFNHSKGYGWVFPQRDYINIGFGAMSSSHSNKEIKELFYKYLDFLVENGIIEKSYENKINKWILPIQGAMKKFTTKRILLAGDAATFVHPISGEGILYAMWSGEYAAKAILNYLKNGASLKSVSKTYSKNCMKNFGKDLLATAKFNDKRDKMDLIIKMAQKDPKLMKLLFDMMGGIPLSSIKYKLAKRILVGLIKR